MQLCVAGTFIFAIIEAPFSETLWHSHSQTLPFQKQMYYFRHGSEYKINVVRNTTLLFQSPNADFPKAFRQALRECCLPSCFPTIANCACDDMFVHVSPFVVAWVPHLFSSCFPTGNQSRHHFPFAPLSPRIGFVWLLSVKQRSPDESVRL